MTVSSAWIMKIIFSCDGDSGEEKHGRMLVPVHGGYWRQSWKQTFAMIEVSQSRRRP